MKHYLSNKTDFHVPPSKISDFYKLIGKSATMDEASIIRAGYGGDKAAINAFATMDNSAASAQIPMNTNALAQFFQHWQSGIVRTATAPRNAEKILGYTQSGSFETEQVVIRSLEQHAGVSAYGDLSDVEHASYTVAHPYRHVVRFQAGLETSLLENLRQSATGINAIEEKRAAVRRAFAINDNAVALFGYNGGSNRTYGLFNDPNIEPYQDVPMGTSGAQDWGGKTWLEKINDIMMSVNRIVMNTNTGFNPINDNFCWVIPARIQTELASMNDLGTQSITDWITKTYPKMRIETLPELSEIAGGADAWYMFAEKAMDVDDSTDDGQVISILSQVKMFLVSTLPNSGGGVDEKYASATAGVFVKRPILVTRASGMSYPMMD